MNWIELVWPAIGGACITLAAIAPTVWIRRRALREHLSVAAMALSIAALALIELRLLFTRDVAEYGDLLGWSQIPILVVTVAVFSLVRFRFQAGLLVLGALACILRALALVANFTTGVNVNFLRIHSLEQFSLGGVMVSAPVADVNPWTLLAHASLLALFLFLISAIVQIHHRPRGIERSHAMTALSGLAFFLLLGSCSAVAMVWFGVGPALIAPPFMAVVGVLCYDLGRRALHAADLTRELAGSESHRLRSELCLAIAVRQAGLGVWSVDVASGEVQCSPEALALMDFAEGARFDRGEWESRVHPDDRPALAQAAQRAEHAKLRTEGTYIEYRIICRDGSIRWLSAAGQVELAVDGSPLRRHGVLKDITIRRQGDERFRNVVRSSPTAMLLVRSGGEVVFANERAENLFGYSHAEFQSLSVDALVPGRWRATHAAQRRSYLQDPVRRDMAASRAIFGLRKDGSEVPIEITINPMREGTDMQVLVTIHDISTRLAAERESALQRDELAHLSRVALLSELSGSLAHELNQPLTAILSNAQAATRFLARDPPDLLEVHESLLNIVESDKRAGEIIRRLRAMLRKEPADFARLDVNEVLQDVLRIVRSDLVNRNIETQLALATSLPLVEGDRVQLQQVLMNLIINGAEAMAAGGDERSLRLHTRQGEGGVLLEVTDGGPGIRENDLERIFDPFVTTKRDGLGLGLAVCRTIIQAHHGRLWATDNDGCGATLHMFLPALVNSSDG